MKTPIKILVVAEFAPRTETSGPIRLVPGKLDDTLAAIKPQVILDGPEVTLTFESMADFDLQHIRERAPAATKDDEHITALLHNPLFQAIEQCWRGLAYLTRALPEEGVIVEILNSPYVDIRQNFYDHVFKPEYDGATDVPLTLALFDCNFNHKAAWLDVLIDLAKMGEALQAPVVAQTDSSLFGVKNLLHLPALADPFDRFKGGEYASFNGFREGDASFWAGLIINRHLLRAPYELDDYKEPVSASKPERYLWARGIWALGANVIDSISKKGHLATISGLGTGGEQTDMPIRELPITRSEKVITPLEASFPLEITEAMPYFGVSPLAQIPQDMGGQNQPDMCYLHLAANLHRIPDPTGERLSLLTVHTTLSYSLMLGRISNLCVRQRGRLSGLAPDAAAEQLKTLLSEELNVSEDDSLEVTVEDENLLHVAYKPQYVIHTKPFEIEIDLPLG